MPVPPDPDPRLWCRFDPARGTLAVAPALCDMQAVPEDTLRGMGFAARIPRARLAAILATLFAGVASGRPFVIPAPFRLAGGRWVESVLHLEPGRRRDWYGVVQMPQSGPAPGVRTCHPGRLLVARKQSAPSQVPIYVEATAELSILEVPVLASTAAPGTITLAEIVDDFLARHAPRLEQRTIETYRERLDTWVLPLYGRHAVSELTGKEIEAWLAFLGRKHLAANTIKLTCTIFGAVLNDAVRAKIIAENPLAAVAGRYRKRVTRQKVYDDRQMTMFLNAADLCTPELAATFAVMGRNGLRVGEARGLTAADVDLVARTLRVDRQVHRGGRVADPKFDSHRVIDLVASVALRLAPILEDARGQRWLFAEHRTHEPVGYRAIRLGMAKAAKAAGLEPLSPKGLRHSAASILAARGVSMEYIRRMLGHTDIRVTQRTYASHLPMERPRDLDAM